MCDVVWQCCIYVIKPEKFRHQSTLILRKVQSLTESHLAYPVTYNTDKCLSKLSGYKLTLYD